MVHPINHSFEHDNKNLPIRLFIYLKRIRIQNCFKHLIYILGNNTRFIFIYLTNFQFDLCCIKFNVVYLRLTIFLKFINSWQNIKRPKKQKSIIKILKYSKWKKTYQKCFSTSFNYICIYYNEQTTIWILINLLSIIITPASFYT